MGNSFSFSRRLKGQGLFPCSAGLVRLSFSPFSCLPHSPSFRWDAITLHYQRADAPMRVALEMRLSGGSQILLAPQRNNNLGTVSIEVLTTEATPEEDWKSFMQQVVNKWTGYRPAGIEGGPYLNARPHWAKEWQGLEVRGKPIETYLKEEAYKEARVEFVKVLEEVVSSRGISLEETRNRFGNPLLERLFFE